ncbi:hypothetical protein U9M48_004405 [Paspalum notatum var. saurae]|uniref:PGG domain-containing protein n=1 Tax=Paspalum notatum var. saurae TaxID=547442 RepID=A0AAQ3PV15_PASNO
MVVQIIFPAFFFQSSLTSDKIMKKRPMLARKENSKGNTPIQLAVLWNKIGVLKVLLDTIDLWGAPLVVSAAFRGHVGVARELRRHCPNAPFCNTEGGFTCMHTAVWSEQPEFLEFILGSPQLNKSVNMRNRDGDTPLHLAVQKCNPKMVAALLNHQHIDVTVLNSNGDPANWNLYGIIDHAKTLNWNEVVMLIMQSDPQDASSILNLYKEAKDTVTESSRKDIKSLTKIYTGNTSLVATLIATMTFAAAFTLPGGSSSDAGSEGLPIMARKFAFQAFLVTDTLAMCASLIVAFICVIARWEDLEFLLYYRSFTKKLM